jgi:hypothetical protein
MENREHIDGNQSFLLTSIRRIQLGDLCENLQFTEEQKMLQLKMLEHQLRNNTMPVKTKIILILQDAILCYLMCERPFEFLNSPFLDAKIETVKNLY